MSAYRVLFDTVLRRIDPETAHHLASWAIRGAGTVASLARVDAPPELAVRTLGLRFPSPFGLAAGFDKDAAGILGLGALGFGHVEVGTLTRHPQPGNPRPRLARLVDDRALVNRMGFNNGGAAAAVPRIEDALRAEHRPVIGVNIGKSRVTPVEEAVEDYVWSARRLAPVADYLAVNVSSPNTPGLRGLQELSLLAPLLAAVRDAAGSTPLLVKISPDLDDEQIDGIVELAVARGLDGIIATNTTTSRVGLSASRAEMDAAGDGGLSGVPLAARSLEVLRRVRSAAPPAMCVISVGGVTMAAEVIERLDAGATLVQGYSAFVFEGPMWAAGIIRGLQEDGWRSPSLA